MGGCVEVGFTTSHVQMRDGKLGENSPVLTFARTEWAAFLAFTLDAGLTTCTEWVDVPGAGVQVRVYQTTCFIRSCGDGPVLTFSAEEVDVFVWGAGAGEFDPEAAPAALAAV